MSANGGKSARPPAGAAPAKESTERLLARVREALGRRAAAGAPVPEAPRIDDELLRLAGPADDLPALFAERAAEMGAVVHRTDAAGLARAIADALESENAREVVTAIEGLAEAAGFTEEAARRGITLTPARALAEGALAKADAAVTGVDSALAESGTLVLHAAPGRERGLSLLPPVHVAVVRASDIVPDLIDTARALSAFPRLPSAVTLVTGPSKTADIEGVLITGVHGPGRLHVIVVRGV